MPLPHDFDLQLAHLQALSGRDAVAALFALLGYNTEARLTQTTEAMGLTAEGLRREVRHVERLADQEDGALQVYLCELRAVTVANTQLIARAARQRAGNFLWVLTSDYERLDFVLFEPQLPEAAEAPGAITHKGAYLRPRTLTVNRRDPGSVALRVLRRFSYTEADADYQFDKLRSAYTIAEWSEPYFNNRALFSDYYLKERLPDTPEWAETERLGATLRQFQALYADARARVNRQPEAAIRRDLLGPALKALGFEAQAEKRKAKDEGAAADYVLRAGDKPVALANAYVWDRSLDGRDELRDPETPDENPGALVVSLLEQEGAPDWAMATNGKLWRLYSRKAHSRATNYYEIDLEEALASPDPGLAFRYFWLLFRAEAFTPAAGGGSFLDRLLDESARYAKELGERLKDRVFEEIFPEFAQGFIAGIRAREGAGAELDEARLAEVFQGTLTFLYRLLFLLYAEARDLLPVRETRGYYEISLTQLKEEVAARAGNILDEAPGKLDKGYGPTETGLYERLEGLFRVVDEGSAALNVPLYNGGLFITKPEAADTTPEARNARFLKAHRMPDRFLARGLDRLARDLDDKTQALAFIDYKSLGVRQLGSIYEGLLEFKLRVAPARLAVVKGKKAEEVVPYREAEKAGKRIRETLPKGAAYLENDRRERKATGSYYTPDYIVKYIVKHTVGPVLQEKFNAMRPRLREAQKAYRAAQQRREAFRKQGMAGDDPEKVANTYKAVVDELFAVRVLDPAMGSGHFLVEAVDFITDGMLNFLNAFPWNPVTAELRRTRETILAEMERQGVTIDAGKLTDVNLLKRHVLKRCIYGVDLNPMAVELAKVSLWLDCFTLGAPLSFLDHHLKAGNSLIGARVDEVREAVEFKQNEQMSLFASSQFTGIMLATDLMRHVGELEDVTADQVRLSRSEYRKATDALAPYKRVMDVYVSRWFGNESTKAQAKFGLEPTIDFLRRPEVKAWLDDPDKGPKKLPADVRKIADTARAVAEEHRFFHWELEFPEVFFGPAAGTTQAVSLKEDAGFDAVVGNPPWVDVQEIAETVKGYLRTVYQAALGKCDLYALFIERGVLLLNLVGVFSMVVQSKFLVTEYGFGLRSFLAQKAKLVQLLHFADAALFGPITVYPLIVIAKRQGSDRDDAVRVALFPSGITTAVIENAISSEVALEPYVQVLSDALFRTDNAWQLDLPTFLREAQRFATGFVQLGEVASVAYGVKTNLDTVYLSDLATWSMRGVENKLLRPAVKPRDFERYHISDDHSLMLFPYEEDADGRLTPLSLAKYPGARTYLENHREALSKRRFYGKTILEQGMQFHELPYVSSYSRQPKVAFPTITKRASFVLDPTGDALFIAPCYVMHIEGQVDIRYLLALLNSRLTDRIVRSRSTDLAGGYMEMQRQYVEAIPIRKIDFTTSVTRRAHLQDEGTRIARKSIDSAVTVTAPGSSTPDHHRLIAWANQRLDSRISEADAVHDLLVYLVDQMMALHNQKRIEASRFLRSLNLALRIREGEDGKAGLDALTGKSAIRNFEGDYQGDEKALPFDELMDILHRNRTRLGVSLGDARLVARLREEYEKSLAVLLPIKARLAFTDKLIDQIVYRLYGLTTEEIAVVEGDNTPQH